MEGDKPRRSQRWDLYIGGVVRRYFLVMFGLAALGAVIGALTAIWPPLVWIAVVAAAIGAIAYLERRTRIEH